MEEPIFNLGNDGTLYKLNANAGIQTTHLPSNPKRHINKAIAYNKQGRIYPAVLIGRLGVDEDYQGTQFRIGVQIMDFIKKWFLSADNKTGCRFILIICNFDYSNQILMDKNEITKYASELSQIVQAFINEYEHPEACILLINLANIDDIRVVYIEETLKPATYDVDWAEYPIIDLINDADAPNEKWEIAPKAIEEVATELLDI